VLHLGTLALYAFHRDEIYMLVCGRHLAWGSPDHAPLAPALSRVASALGGASPVGQRVLAALAGTATVWWTARLARRLGGNPEAQLVAAACAVIAPALLFQSGVYTTGTLDALCWIAACDAFVAASASGRAAAWLGAGAAVGLGLLAKYTALLCAGGLALGLALGPQRHQLRRAGPWLAVAVAAGLALPNLAWQIAHGMPAWAFASDSHASITRRFTRLDVLLAQPFIVHPLSFAVALLGLRAALRSASVERTLAILFGLLLGVVVLVPGKPHYVLPAYLPLFAVGARPVGAWLEARRRGVRTAVAVGWLAAGGVAFLLTLPVVPQATLLRLRVDRVNAEIVQFADWRAVAQAVARAQSAAGRPLHALTDSYGTAAALELYGPSLGLLAPFSGANSFYLRPPGADDVGDALLALGYAEPLLDALCGERTAVGTVESGLGVDNRYDFPRTIWLCRPRTQLRALWPRLHRFD
jgi:4-amino-4-deoxy-L-arabinose transferase-like glycosyltransferase